MVADWEHKTIGDITLAVKDGTHGTYSRYDRGEPLLSSKNITDGKIITTDSESYISEEDSAEITKNGFPQKNDVLLSCVGTIGKCCVYEWDKTTAFQRSVIFMRPDPDQIDSYYLMYVMQSPDMHSQEEAKAQASVQKGLYIGLVEQLELDLPPLPEQKRIASILGDLDDLIEKQAKIIDKKKRFRDAIATYLFNNQIWPQYEIAKLCSNITAGGDVPDGTIKGQKAPSVERPYPVYSNGLGEQALYGYAPTYRIAEDSITVAARGTIGFNAIRQGKFTPIIRLITLQPKSNVSISYLNQWLKQVEYEDMGSGVPQLPVPTFEKTLVPLPSFKEQSDIGEILDNLDDELADLSRELDKAKNLKAALLHQLITGKIRVAGKE